MALTNEGLNTIVQSIAGQGVPFSSANAFLAVGNGTAAFDASQTDLQGTVVLKKAVDAGYPMVSGSTLSLKATFGPDEANFAWNEWGVFNALAGGVMLNRVVESNGTKQSGQTWVLEVDITFSTGS